MRMRDDRAGEGEGARQCWEEVLTREGIDYVEKGEAEERSCSRLVSWAISFSSINGDNSPQRVVVGIKGDKIKHVKSLKSVTQ